METNVKILAQGCRVITPNDGETFNEGTRQYRSPIGQKHGSQYVAQSISSYSHGRSATRRNAQSEEVLYTVSGNGTCYVDGHAYRIETGTAVYVPPAAHYQIDNPNTALIEIVSVCCPEESSVEISSAVVPPESSNARTLTVRESEREPIKTGDRTFKLLVDKDLGCERVTQFVGVIPPGRSPHHYHTYEEAIFILQGSGIVWADDECCEFSTGTSIYLPIGQRHMLENTGDDDVRLLGVFYPSGSPATRYSD
jgi:mannose-6-phosphate isomerase-like protein (cupin superfamily)